MVPSVTQCGDGPRDVQTGAQEQHLRGLSSVTRIALRPNAARPWGLWQTPPGGCAPVGGPATKQSCHVFLGSGMGIR